MKTIGYGQIKVGLPDFLNQQTFASSKSTVETLEKGMKYVWT